MLRRAVFTFLVCASALGSIFESGVPAQATHPFLVPGSVVYREFQSPPDARSAPSSARLGYCVLFHGHGFSQDWVQVLEDVGDSTLTGLSGLTDVAGISQLAELTGLKIDALSFLSFGYFSENLINGLLAQRCDRVVVAFQESNQSTIAELTQRAARLLVHLGCGSQASEGTRGCGILGHSKMGAAVTSLVRQCMDGDQGSELGESGCRSLAEVYAASGVNEGVGVAAMVRGLAESKQFDLARGLAGGLFDGMLLLGGGLKLAVAGVEKMGGVDLTGPFEPGRTNPLWFDLSPLAVMENQRTLIENHATFFPQRRGYFQGEYAASGTGFNFQNDAGLLSCGLPATVPADPLRARVRGFLQDLVAGKNGDLMTRFFSRGCEASGRAMEKLHRTPSLRQYFEIGKASWRREVGVNNDLAKALDAFTWEDFQVSDGMVERRSALGVCERGLGKATSAVTHCASFADLNHLATAGGAPEAASDIIEQFGEHLAPAKRSARRSF